MKKYKKIIFTFILLIGIIFLLQRFAFASEEDPISKLADNDNMKAVGNVSYKSSWSISKIINTAIKILQYAGTGISVIVVTITGIKYMLASPNEKSDIKKMAMPLIIGCVLLFGAVNLVKLIADFGISLNLNK